MGTHLEVERFSQHDLEDLLHVDGVASRAEDLELTRNTSLAHKWCAHGLGEPLGLLRDLLLLLERLRRKEVEFGPDENWDGGLLSAGIRGTRAHLIESACLPIPLLYTVERRFPCEVEHEQDRNGVVGHEWQHGHEFALSA